jgi:hypothetical protein
LLGGGLALRPCPAAAQASANVIYLDQAWSQEDREWYYHFSQGSAILSYDIFLNLEVAGGQELFRSDANSVRYGMIPEEPNSMNPDGLPIGISKTSVTTPIEGWPLGDYAGLTCAACHETFEQGHAIALAGGDDIAASELLAFQRKGGLTGAIGVDVFSGMPGRLAVTRLLIILRASMPAGPQGENVAALRVAYSYVAVA